MRLVPWSARLAPTGSIKQANLNAFLRSCLHGCVHNVVPFGRLNLDVSARSFVFSYALVANKGAVDARFLHGFKVVDDAFAANIT